MAFLSYCSNLFPILLILHTTEFTGKSYRENLVSFYIFHNFLCLESKTLKFQNSHQKPSKYQILQNVKKKCLKVRQKLGTRENLKIWKNLKIWNFEIYNSSSWSSGHAEQLLFSCPGSKVTFLLPKIAMLFFGQQPRHPIPWH